MALTQDQIDQFRIEGYTIAPTFFDSDEIKAMQAEVERLKANGKLRNVATAGDGKTESTTQVNMQLCPTVSHSPLFRALPFENKVIEAVTALIGTPIILHLDQVFLKPPKVGMGTNWHQDNAYFKIRNPLMGTAMWIAIHDATLENGTLSVIPGSFKEEYEHSRDPYSNHHVRCFPPEDNVVPAIIPAGGVIFFCYGTAHCTRDNMSDSERAGMAYHFLRVEYANDDLIAADRDYRPYLSGSDASGGEKEYGTRIAGTWKDEVAALI